MEKYVLYRVSGKKIEEVPYEGNAVWDAQGSRKLKCQDTVERRWNIANGVCTEYGDVPGEIRDDYEPGFFTDRVLVAVTWLSSSGSNRITACDAIEKDGNVYIRLTVDIPPIGTCDMAAFLNCIVFGRDEWLGS